MTDPVLSVINQQSQAKAEIKQLNQQIRQLENQLAPLYQAKRDAQDKYHKLDQQRWHLLGKEIAVLAPEMSGQVYAEQQIQQAILMNDVEAIEEYARYLPRERKNKIIKQLLIGA